LNYKIKNTKIIKTLPTSTLTGSKLGCGAKIATESKLKGLRKSCFFRGPKSQL